jgi:hypothetical protein
MAIDEKNIPYMKSIKERNYILDYQILKINRLKNSLLLAKGKLNLEGTLIFED